MFTIRLMSCLTAGILACTAVFAAELRPDQELLVAHMVAGLEPSTRESLRADTEKQVAAMSPEEVAATMTALGIDPQAPPPAQREPAAPMTSAGDSHYHRNQYEPVYRESWRSQRAFDDFVTAELAARCPDRHQYAVVMGPARYEVPQLAHTPLASWNPDNDLKVFASIAPQDGRYEFDFSKIKTTWDTAKVAAAISEACIAWTAIAAEFYRQTQPFEQAGNGQKVYELEKSAAARFYPLADKLASALEAEAPSNNEEFFMALVSGQPAVHDGRYAQP